MLNKNDKYKKEIAQIKIFFNIYILLIINSMSLIDLRNKHKNENEIEF